jgi:hypothetical protein
LPSGFILTKNGWETFSKSPGTGDSYSVYFYYTYEIVVIDSDVYKVGKLIIDNTTPVTSIFSGGTPANICVSGETDLLTAITNELKIPGLPQPTSPTCASARLQRMAAPKKMDQSVKLASGLLAKMQQRNRNQSLFHRQQRCFCAEDLFKVFQSLGGVSHVLPG